LFAFAFEHLRDRKLPVHLEDDLQQCSSSVDLVLPQQHDFSVELCLLANLLTARSRSGKNGRTATLAIRASGAFAARRFQFLACLFDFSGSGRALTSRPFSTSISFKIRRYSRSRPHDLLLELFQAAWSAHRFIFFLQCFSSYLS